MDAMRIVEMLDARGMYSKNMTEGNDGRSEIPNGRIYLILLFWSFLLWAECAVHGLRGWARPGDDSGAQAKHMFNTRAPASIMPR
ncbi:hypothetical protein NOF04DRAFT_9675 [Fusarium oxysporum II5]|uniref:Uncharacterized protein n=2 Tax=Fusarium oxysporum species complex TaxID=171631 RepID=X0JJ93_FUSO5|nr:uncharacterized protein FOIG_11344 [Fusarium odoratissimum NRRL 54006]EXL96385.1 hypothetical protein FOIG_11344 [Fusarium odoratissimum NRRL 54006]KAK2125573.1 hypothetical protein NOF04DRAFT_9675 [Fusarium oxysporum II5]TXB99972.1 hypothetical protein FocTR4_00013748 [Fusarium oxysporum f. sp. cubense]